MTLHFATERGEPVASRARVARWIRRANEEFGPFGISVRVVSVRHMPTGWAEVTRWRSRRQMAHYAPRDGTVHVFVVEELDTSTQRVFRRRIRGLHWRYHGLSSSLKGREYVVVTRDAPTTTLSHELGHLFGLRHSFDESNIMCSCRRGSNVRFDHEQGLSMRKQAIEYLATSGRNAGPRAADRAVFRRRR